MSRARRVVALSGGIGGAKLALGLYQVLADDALTLVCNIGDDFTHLGFYICPDIDTVLYTLAQRSNRETGWGRDGETWQFMQALKEIGGEDWFNLGDKDLATHVFRTQRMQQGKTLSDICAELTRQFNLKAQVLPATNDVVPTTVITPSGRMAFQHYFVRDQCAPTVTGFSFDGAKDATPAQGVLDALLDETVDAIVICPSNPFISIDPILSIPNIRKALIDSKAPVIAVSPIISGQAVKGPTAKMMAELGLNVSATTVAERYVDFLDGYVLDDADEQLADSVSVPVLTTATMMHNDNDKRQLAEHVLGFAEQLL